MYAGSPPPFRPVVCADVVGELVIIVNPGHDLQQLKSAMANLLDSSPNCAEFMHQYRSKESKETIVRLPSNPNPPSPSSSSSSHLSFTPLALADARNRKTSRSIGL